MKEQDVLKALGAKIREYRKAAGLSQEQLAEKAGCSLDTIGRLERGIYFTTSLVLYRIGAAVGRNVDELFTAVPRIKKKPEAAAVDQAVAQFRQMLESGQSLDVEDLAAMFDRAARKLPKTPRKR
jgi:transcriptional regulator with XRE-family HTH domain